MRKELGGWEWGLTPKAINSFRRNSPELIIRDAQRMLGLDDGQCEVLRQILLARAVNKWFKARRDVIKFQHELKDRIIELNKRYRKWHPADQAEWKLLNEIREQLRAICHRPRWVEWPRIGDPRQAEKKIKVVGNEGPA